jgi:hypothetical protein
LIGGAITILRCEIGAVNMKGKDVPSNIHRYVLSAMNLVISAPDTPKKQIENPLIDEEGRDL